MFKFGKINRLAGQMHNFREVDRYSVASISKVLNFVRTGVPSFQSASLCERETPPLCSNFEPCLGVTPFQAKFPFYSLI